MTVTLSKKTEAIVQAQLRTGRYATPDDVVNHLLEEHQSVYADEALPDGPSDAELRASLLVAVNKPTIPYRKGEFVELAKQVIADCRRA